MNSRDFDATFKERCDAIGKMLCEVTECNSTIRELAIYLRGADLKLQVDVNKILVEGFRAKALKMVVALEELENYVKSECSDTEKKMSLLTFVDWFLEKIKGGCELGSEFMEKLEKMGKGGIKCEE